MATPLGRTAMIRVKPKIPPKKSSELLARLFISVVFIVYAVRIFRLISRYAVNVFFFDQWDFNNATLFQRHSMWQMFRAQHGPHRQGVGALFQRMVEPLFRWNSRTESFVVGGLIVAAAICALGLKRKLFGSVSVFDVVISAIVLTTAQWQTLFMSQNFAHGPFPLLLLLLYCVAWTSDRQAVRYPLVLFINFLTIYTGFGVFLGVLTPILLVLDYWASAPQSRLSMSCFIGTLSAALASLGSFFIGYKFYNHSAADCFSLRPQSPMLYGHFVTLMFANFFSLRRLTVSTTIVGIIVLAAVLIALAASIWPLLRQTPRRLTRDEYNRALIIVALIAFTLLFCVNTAYGRLCLGLPAASVSRYVIYLEPAVLGLYFFLLSLRSGPIRMFLLIGFLMATVAASLHRDRAGMGAAFNVKEHWKTCYLQTENIEKCNAVAGPVYPVSQHHNLKEKLDYLKKTRQNLYSDQKLP
jgi:hypothetical protein